MVSLANGNSDVLRNPVNSADSSGVEFNQKSDPTSSDQVLSRKIRHGIIVKRKIPNRSNSVTSECQSELTTADTRNSLVDNFIPTLNKQDNSDENATKNLPNGSDDLSSSFSTNQIMVNGNNNTELLDSEPVTRGSNLVLVGNLKSQGENRKVYLVHSDLLKSSSEMGTGEQGANINNIIRFVERESRMKIAGEMKVLKNLSTNPSFVQLSQKNLKSIGKNITLNVTPSSANTTLPKTNNILRAKLLENREGSFESTTVPVRLKTITKIPMTTSHVYVSKPMYESSAVAEARLEVSKYRKKLIETATSSKLPKKCPLIGYVGPTFTCEICDDTFVSEESLTLHKDRRSVLFTYDCPSCKQILEFYNHCMFRQHLCTHDSVVEARYLTISTIPASKLKFQVLEDEEESSPRSDETAPCQTFTAVATGTLPLMKSLERASDSSTVRIVKSMKKKKLVLSTASDEATNEDRISNTSSLKQLLCEPTQTSILNENSKSNDASSESESTPVIEKKKKLDCIAKSKSKVQSSVSNLEQIQSTKSVSNEAKNILPSANSALTENSTNAEEIFLNSSDEEEKLLPDSNDKSPKLVTCRDCKQEVPNLTRHYRGENRPKKEYPCKQCNFVNSSACALSAHVRMHTKTQPYVCPDCGYFFSILEEFLFHVKQVCFYDFKNIRFSCPECSMLKPSAPKFADHLRHEHIREVFKCGACITSSYSLKTVEEHIKKMHPNAESPINIIEGYWCKLCPNVLVAKPIINHHVNQHVYSLQYMRYVYICKTCKTYGSVNRGKFAHHYNECCGLNEAVTSLPKVKKVNRLRKVEETNLNVRKSPEVFKKDQFSTRGRKIQKKTKFGHDNVEEGIEKDASAVEDWEVDKMKTDFEPDMRVCMMCRSTDLSEKSSLFCYQCVRFVDVEDTIESSGATDDGANNRLKRKFKCKLCKEYMNRDWSTITKHFEMFHQSDFDVRTKMRNSTDAGFPAFGTNRKRKLSTKGQENNKMMKLDSKYKCAKCNMSTNERVLFHEHIMTHKSQSDFQCLECGECFIVKLSLEKHLIVSHKIRSSDLKEYFKENGVEESDNEKEEERALVENQCEVCFAECGTKQNYDKHIRTHGMAFVAMQSKAKS